MGNSEKLQYFRAQQLRLSGRLRALSFKTLRQSEVCIDGDAINTLLSNQKVHLSSSDNLALLERKTRKYIAETGRSELYIATAFIEDNKLQMKAPLILIPVMIEKGQAGFDITIRDEVQINKLLIYKLCIERNIAMPKIEALEKEVVCTSKGELLSFLNEIVRTFSIGEALDTYTAVPFSNFDPTVTKQTIQTSFVMSLMPKTTSAVIYDYTKLIETNQISKALDEMINQHKMGARPQISYFPLPTYVSSNASQDKIISSVLAGNNTIVQGPPGTGKSQLISNLIFQALLNNKKILFVSEKKTAIDVVDKRIGDLNNYAMYVSDVRDKQAFFDRIKKSVNSRQEQTQNQINEQNHELKSQAFEELTDIYQYINRESISKQENKDKHYNSAFKTYLRSKSRTDLITLESYINDGKYSLWEKFKHLFKRELKKDVYEVESLAVKMFTNQNFDINFKSSEDLTTMIHAAYAKNTEALEEQNTYALKTLDRLRGMFTPSDAITHVSRLKTYPRKTLYNFAKENKKELMAYYPIWIMALDAALEVLPQEQEIFDYIVVDEGSQVEYSKILPLINRAKNYVIVGDKQQLQPSEYFTETIEFESDGTAVSSEMEDFEEGKISIIDFAERVVDQKNMNMLMNHYRSADAKLIEFSNVHFYENKMNIVSKMDFYDPNVIEVIDVQGEFSGETGVNMIEVETIIAQIGRMFNEKPGKSIGIVVMNKQMEECVDKKLAEALETTYKEEYAKYMATEKIDPIIIKNLESIQGDERDIIIFSLTYGISEKGRLNNLGPITHDGGQNRINVAITRSKEKMIVIKSLKGSDFTVEESHSDGRKLFKEYITFLDTVNSEEGVSENKDEDIRRFINALESKYPGRYDYVANVNQGAYHIHVTQVDKETKKVVKCYVFVDKVKLHDPFDIFYYHQFLKDRKWDVLYVESKFIDNDEYMKMI